MRWGRKCTGREIWENFAFLKLQPSSSGNTPLPSWVATPASSWQLHPISHLEFICRGPGWRCSHLAQPGESPSSPSELWAAENLPRVSACLSPGCGYPETALSEHTKGFLGIREVMLTSFAIIIASSLREQVGGLSEVVRERQGLWQGEGKRKGLLQMKSKSFWMSSLPVWHGTPEE